jgi:CheY-like chemotaxis protein
MRLHQDQEQTAIYISLPAAPPVRVLVVDDNEDLLHFYRRYLQETRYQIIPLTDGARLFEMLESVEPDVIVLDVMLPTTDGWELLTLLRQHPLGRNLPILICSVIQEKELALALGASGYLEKPVRRSSLLQALDAAIQQGGAGSPG